MKKILQVCLLMLSLPSFAAVVVIQGEQCIKATHVQVAKSLINYSNYHKIDDKMRYGFSFLGTFYKFVEMVQSDQLSMTTNRTSQGITTSSYIYITFRPFNLKEASKLYPRSTLKCDTALNRLGYYQNCKMVPFYAQAPDGNFAFNDIEIDITVLKYSPKCYNDQVNLVYKAIVDTNKADVNAIKEGVITSLVGSTGPVAVSFRNTLNTYFNDDTFFRNYFNRFFTIWLDSL